MAKKDNKDKITKNIVSNFILWTLIIIVSLTVLNYVDVGKKTKEIPYSSFLSYIFTVFKDLSIINLLELSYVPIKF